MEPIFCVGQDIEDIDGLEPFRDQPLQGFEPAWDGAGSQATQHGLPIDKPHGGVGGEAGIYGGGEVCHGHREVGR